MNFTSAYLDEPAVPLPRVHILGVGITVADLSEAIRQSDELIRSGNRGYICAADAHSLVESLRNPSHREALNDAYLTLADGMPLVWIGWLRGFTNMGRVYGPDYLLEMCRLSVKRGWRHFFYGGKPEIAERLAARLVERFPRLQIAGTYTPPFRPLTSAEESEFAARLEETKPDVLWVGLGAPKQERFMAEHCGKLQCRLMVGVGAAFDFHSGAVKEAPRWLHKTGLQWAYRLMQEPQRLGRRYLNSIPAFVWHFGLEAMGVERLSRETPLPLRTKDVVSMEGSPR